MKLSDLAIILDRNHHSAPNFGQVCQFGLNQSRNSVEYLYMDRFDALILEVIQRDARITAEALSPLVGLSPDACRKRLARLRASDFVEQEIAVLNPQKVGRGITLIVEVTLENERIADIDLFKARIQAAPEVMQCYYVTGSADFILIVSAKDMADYEAFTRKYFFADKNIKRFRSNAVMERVKTGFFMPVAHSAEE